MKDKRKRDRHVLVSIVMGSDSDLNTMCEAANILRELRIPFEVTITSAHRSPSLTRRYIRELNDKGVKLVIAGAGLAAHLPGAIASETILPVIGVPMETKSLSGQDSLYSIVQMPAGVPVATMAIGKPGAKNAALLASEILALSNKEIAKRLMNWRKVQESCVQKKSTRLKKLGYEKYMEAK